MAKKVHHEEHPDETWLIPYADMLTLLLALFIVMFAMGKVDQAKFEALASQFNVIFAGGTGVLKTDAGAIIPMPVPATPGPSGGTGGTTGGAIGTGTGGTGIKNGAMEQDAMQAIKNDLEKAIAESDFNGRVQVELGTQGLTIVLQDIVLFASGGAEVQDGVKPLLVHVAGMLQPLGKNEIEVAGHTDNIPMKNGFFRSNWELSAYRAINVMNFLISEGKMDPSVFSIQAFGEFKPKYSNETEDGRARNRRVEINVVRRYAGAAVETGSVTTEGAVTTGAASTAAGTAMPSGTVVEEGTPAATGADATP